MNKFLKPKILIPLAIALVALATIAAATGNLGSHSHDESNHGHEH